jgi:hypothetical protein
MAFKYPSPEWEHVRDMLFYCGTNQMLGHCNALAADIVEKWKGPDTDILQIVIRSFSLRQFSVGVQEKIKEYLTTASTGQT